MTYWTIQDPPAWVQAQAYLVLTGNTLFVDPDFKAAYDWMVAQMQARLGTRPPAYPAVPAVRNGER